MKEFLHPQLSDVTNKKAGINPAQLKKAVKRIQEAIKNNEKIVVYGDYDVDGICGTAVLWETLYKQYKNVVPFIPNRIEEGYGLSIIGIENLLQKHPDLKLIITVDNGIVAYEAVEFATGRGIDIIITDHHVKGKLSIASYATVHTPSLCGTGISYMLSLALEGKEAITGQRFLDLVALATIVDLVPLIGVNRTLVKFGLGVLARTDRVGLTSIFEIARINPQKIGTYEVGYIIGPRLNAMGRLSNAMDSLRLLCTKDRKKGFMHAVALDKTNRQRQLLTEEMVLHAKSSIRQDSSAKIIFASHKTYNQGVIGLVASKLVEEYYRPSFVLSVGDKLAKGSARSIYGVNIIEMIRSVSSSLVLEAGGHPMAAGFTIKTEKVEEFRLALESLSDKIIHQDQLTRTLPVDFLLDFKDVSFDLVKRLNQLEPFGMGNPRPIFGTEDVSVADMRILGRDKSHLRLTVEKNGISLPAIAFGFGKDTTLRIGDKIDIAYNLEENVWNGSTALQLKIKDIILC